MTTIAMLNSAIKNKFIYSLYNACIAVYRFCSFHSLNSILTFVYLVLPTYLPPDHPGAIEQRWRSPAAECSQWQLAAGCRAMDAS